MKITLTKTHEVNNMVFFAGEVEVSTEIGKKLEQMEAGDVEISEDESDVVTTTTTTDDPNSRVLGSTPTTPTATKVAAKKATKARK